MKEKKDFYHYIKNNCFKLEVLLMVKKLKTMLTSYEGYADQIIKNIHQLIINNSRGYDVYVNLYGSDKAVEQENKVTFKGITDDWDVEEIENDILLNEIESFLVDGFIERRLSIKKSMGSYKYSIYQKEFYEFLKERGVELLDSDLFLELGLTRLFEDDEKTNLPKVIVNYGKFEKIKLKELQNFIIMSEHDDDKMEILKFYVSLYVYLAEEAELIGLKRVGSVIEALIMIPESGVKENYFGCHKLEAIVMLHLLRDYMKGEEKVDGICRF